ncbi:atp-dependent dna helicase pif1 [Fusarium agapanthi]|uniref:ATP-dependent DNA helicase n=1 Tax=Fusarium agapanthi TaxID=1803897 RepID=A0A9P5BJM4_9HYPO|nr:atp-dependent dna helicase pif1 [Fusarium agapanthi]
MRGPAPSTFSQRDTPRAPLKRKLDTNAQAPTSANEPKRFQRSSSLISIHSSSDDDEAPNANSSSRANAKSSPQQPRSNKNTMANFLAMGKQKPPQKSSPPKPSHKPSHKPSQMPPQITQQMPQQTRREILLQKIQQLEQQIAEQKSQKIPQQLPPMPLLPSNPSTSGPAANENDFADVDLVPEPTLCREQQDLLDLIMSGRNVFFTGSAGCGKSTVLKAAVKKLRAAGKIVHITAPTGRAALGVNGVTTWSYMGWTIDAVKVPLSELQRDSHRKTVKARLMETDVLVIDEISMVENHHLQRMNECLKSARCWSPQHSNYSPTAPPFGGIQLLVTGDFCQLPPVKPFEHCIRCGSLTIPDAERSPTEWNCTSNCGPFYVEDQWAFRSAAWEEAHFTHVHLKEIHRQSDKRFVKMLQKCRLGIPFSDEEGKMLLRQNPDDPKFRNVTKLFAYKKAVQTENRKSFERLPGEATIYEAIDGFDWREQHTELQQYKDKARRDKYSDVPYVNGTLEQCKESPLDAYVEMKVNALVMLKVNLDTEKGLVNGSQGIVVGWEPYDPDKLPNTKKATLFNIDVLAGHHADWRARKIREYAERRRIRKWPIVRFNNGITRTIYPSIVVNTLGATEPYSVLYRTQLPLVLAWAVSIHKSQGMTLTHVTTDLGQAWEQALKYVALSRVTSLDGLAILKPGGWKKRESRKDSLAVIETSSHEVREFLEDKFGRNLFTDLEGNR